MFGNKFFSAIGLFILPLIGFSGDLIEVVQTVPLETHLSVPGVRETKDVWLEMINGSKSTIDLEQFYLSEQPGEALTPILDAIQAAAKRGVKIRFLMDSKFMANYPEPITQMGKLENISMRIIDFSKMGGIQHAKFFVVDGTQCFVGSHNMDWRALSHIHEVGLRVNSSETSALVQSIFNKDWAYADPKGTPVLSLSEPMVSDVTPSDAPTVDATPKSANPTGVGYSADAIVSLLNSAQKLAQIQVYQYNTSGKWQVLDSAIRQAASRGVHVQILVDAVSMRNGKADLLALAGLKNIEVQSVQIPNGLGEKSNMPGSFTANTWSLIAVPHGSEAQTGKRVIS